MTLCERAAKTPCAHTERNAGAGPAFCVSAHAPLGGVRVHTQAPAIACESTSKIGARSHRATRSRVGVDVGASSPRWGARLLLPSLLPPPSLLGAGAKGTTPSQRSSLARGKGYEARFTLFSAECEDAKP